MKKLLKLMVAKRLAGMPAGLAVLGLSWLLARRRRHHQQAVRESGRSLQRGRMVRAGRH